MLIVDKTKVKEILVNELGYKPSEAEVFLVDFPSIHDELAPTVEQWLKDRSVNDVSVNGLALSELMRNRHRNFLLAVRELNLLLDPNLTPEKQNKLTAILRKPLRIL